MATPEVSIGCCKNVYVRHMNFKKKGDVEIGHEHPFDHLQLLGKGSVLVTVNGEKSVFTAPAMIFIKAEEVHSVEALEDDTNTYCIHALRDGAGVGDILDPKMIPKGVDPMTLAKPLINRLKTFEVVPYE